MKPSATISWFCFDNEINSCVSIKSDVSGFSHQRCFSDSSTFIPCFAWRPIGVERKIISKGKSQIIGNYLNVGELKKLAKEIKKALITRERELSLNF